jgi:DNA polymerase III epsilon subunit-like protein
VNTIFVAIDVETTGLEAGTDEIIEVAAVKFRGTEVLETFQRLVRRRRSGDRAAVSTGRARFCALC